MSKEILNKLDALLDQIASHPTTDKIATKLAYYNRRLSGFRQTTTKLLATITRPAWDLVVTAGRRIDRVIDASLHTVVGAISSGVSSTWRKVRDLQTDSISKLQRKPLWQYLLLIRFHKPIGTFLLLWPTVITLWIAAEGVPDTDVLIVFTLGVFLMRSAGCAINDYADRDIDGEVERTRDRPLATGAITPDKALLVFMALAFTAFFLVLFMNKLTIFLSAGGALLAASYPFMKRYHYLPQVHLGAAFGWAVPMAFTAQTNELQPVAWLLFCATLLWTTAYDTIYGMIDRDDDLKIGVKSTAILFGDADRLMIGVLQACFIATLVMVGTNLELSGIYYAGVIAVAGFCAYQQHLIRDRSREHCLQAFLNNNWLGMTLFFFVVLEYWIGGYTS